jgi:hypothetical protein
MRSSMLVQSTITKSSTKNPLVGFHLQWSTPELGFKRSLICSLYISVKEALMEYFSAPLCEYFLNRPSNTRGF